MFTTAFSGQFSHQKRFRFLFTFNCKMVFFILFGKHMLLSRDTRRHHRGRQCGFTLAGAWTLKYEAGRNKYSRCQGLRKYFERARSERNFACSTRETTKWKKEWPLWSNRKIINEQKKKHFNIHLYNTEPLSIFTHVLTSLNKLTLSGPK